MKDGKKVDKRVDLKIKELIKHPHKTIPVIASIAVFLVLIIFIRQTNVQGDISEKDEKIKMQEEEVVAKQEIIVKQEKEIVANKDIISKLENEIVLKQGIIDEKNSELESIVKRNKDFEEWLFDSTIKDANKYNITIVNLSKSDKLSKLEKRIKSLLRFKDFGKQRNSFIINKNKKARKSTIFYYSNAGKSMALEIELGLKFLFPDGLNVQRGASKEEENKIIIQLMD